LEPRGIQVQCIMRVHGGAVMIQTASGRVMHVHPARLKALGHSVANEVKLKRQVQPTQDDPVEDMIGPEGDLRVMGVGRPQASSAPLQPPPSASPLHSAPPIPSAPLEACKAPIGSPAMAAKARAHQPQKIFQAGGPASKPELEVVASMTVKQALMKVDESAIKEAQIAELRGFKEMGVIDRISPSEGDALIRSKQAQLMGSRWVIAVKDDPGQVKARLTTQDFTDQRSTIDAATPTLQIDALRMLLALKAGEPMSVADVTKAYLNADADELEMSILIRPPVLADGQATDQDGWFWRNQKAMYGTIDAVARWRTTLVSALTNLGYVECALDPCIYIKWDEKVAQCIIAFHVDDLFGWGDGVQHDLLSLGFKVSKVVHLSKVGDKVMFAGLSVTMTDQGFCIDVDKNIQEKMVVPAWSKRVNTPLSPHNLEADEVDEPIPPRLTTTYRSMVGSASWVNQVVYPMISYATNYLSRFNKGPNESVLIKADKLIKFIKDNPPRLEYQRLQTPIKLQAFADASWAAKRDGYRSVTGYLITLTDSSLAQNQVSWKTKVQVRSAKSSMSAELDAAATTMAHV